MFHSEGKRFLNFSAKTYKITDVGIYMGTHWDFYIGSLVYRYISLVHKAFQYHSSLTSLTIASS